MVVVRSASVFDPIRSLYASGSASGADEADLVRRFVARRDEAAFAALVARYGPMVMAVCRRRLDRSSDADDAFQATFLVLARKAAALRDPGRLGPWLHGVALRVARRARREALRRAAREGQAAPIPEIPAGDPQRDAERAELRSALDDELARLPGRLRDAVVSCDLLGLTHDEAARRLRWPLGTVKSRLAAARARLRGRLARRGLAPAVVAALLADRPATAALAPAVATAAARAAVGSPTPAASRLASRTFRDLVPTRTVALGLVLIASALAAGARGLMIRDDPPAPVAAAEEPLPTRDRVRDALKSWWDSMETLAFRDEEFPLDGDGRLDRERGGILIDYAHGRGDLRAVAHKVIRPDGSEVLMQERRINGAEEIYLVADTERGGQIVSANVGPADGDRDHYRGEMGVILSLFLPLSVPDRVVIPLHVHLDRGAPLEIGRDADGRPTATLVIGRGPASSRLDLDLDHGWLPRRVRGPMDVDVTRFTRVAGHWFPAEGTFRHPGPSDEARRRGFVVRGLRINQPLPESRFRLTETPDEAPRHPGVIRAGPADSRARGRPMFASVARTGRAAAAIESSPTRG